MKVVALAGGTGSAKLLRGLASLGHDLTVVANVGDNVWVHGLCVCPDIDIAAYTLAGLADGTKGWGIQGDTFAALGQMGALGGETWFALGDRDLATHIMRTAMIRRGETLTQATAAICRGLGLKARILPATDSPLETRILTGEGEVNLQEFWVKKKGRPAVKGVRYEGAESAEATAEVKDAIGHADRVVVCPANPVTSIGPILAVKGLAASLAGARAKVTALSPMVGRAPFSGPAGKLMKASGVRTDSVGVASLYLGFLDAIVIGRSDAEMVRPIGKLGVGCLLSDTLLGSPAAERRLARELLEA